MLIKQQLYLIFFTVGQDFIYSSFIRQNLAYRFLASSHCSNFSEYVKVMIFLLVQTVQVTSGNSSIQRLRVCSFCDCIFYVGSKNCFVKLEEHFLNILMKLVTDCNFQT